MDRFSADRWDCLCFPLMRSRRCVAREDGACGRSPDDDMTSGPLRREERVAWNG